MTTQAPGLVASYPRVRVRGRGVELGRDYGRQCRDRVHGSVALYREVFGRLLGVDWGWFRMRAREYLPYIEAFSPKYAAELRGLAAGAELELDDVLALNARTEIIGAASVHRATGQGGMLIPECSSFAVERGVTAHDQTLIGQNWDYLVGTERNVVVLEVEQDEGPSFVTVVEAGLLAKIGMNDRGIALATNGLVTERDTGAPGVPFHVILRALLDQPTIADGLGVVQRATRASSGHYLLGEADLVVGIETSPGTYEHTETLFPRQGILAHTNHFVALREEGTKVAVWDTPASPLRLSRLESLLGQAPRPLDVTTVQHVLADHADHPWGVCTHEQPAGDGEPQFATRASLIMAPAERRMWLAEGNPCAAPFAELDVRDLLERPRRA